MVKIDLDKLVNHLRVAAEVYRKDAEQKNVQVTGLAETFVDQAKQCNEWADALENRLMLFVIDEHLNVEVDD